MGQGLISEKYLHDIAEAIRVKTDSQLTITPMQMAEAISNIDGSISGEIVKSSDTNVGMITDSILTGIANAIRSKLDVLTEFTPAQMADAILSITKSEVLEPLDYFNIPGIAISNKSQTSGAFGFTTKEGRTAVYGGPHGSTANTNASFSEPIPAGYKWLCLDIDSTGRTYPYNNSELRLHTQSGVNDYMSGFNGTQLKRVIFTMSSGTAGDINSQSGVYINTDSIYTLKRQKVYIDISDIDQDSYVDWHRCDNETTIYSLFAYDELPELQISITYPTGWACSISNGTKTFTAPDSSGYWEFHYTPPTIYNPFTIEVTNGTLTATRSLICEPDKQYSEVALDVGVFVRSWGDATDAEIMAIVSALDRGDITISQIGWEIGDERTVSLSAMPATYVGESQSAQNVTMVLMDSGHYDLVSGGKDHFVVGLKTALNTNGYINPTYPTTWENSQRRKWCNEIFRSAIPEDLRNCFKPFYVISAGASSSAALITTEDYFSLFAEKECAAQAKWGYQKEADALSRVSYFSNHAISRYAYTRSRMDNSWVYIESSKAPPTSNCGYGASYTTGIMPFGCI